MNYAHSGTLFIVHIYDLVAVDFADVAVVDFVSNTRIYHFVEKSAASKS